MKKQVQYLIPAALIVNSEDKILLVRKKTARTQMCLDRWEIPGGTLKFGEEFMDGAKRKVKEYIGLDVEPKRIIPYVYSSVTTGILDSREVEMQFYVEGVECELVDEGQELQLNKERIIDAKWFSRDKYLDLSEDDRSPGDLEIIRAAGAWEV